MELESGTRLGPYEIVSPIGAGGMGEVWKARDTRLERSVAIKVLPAQFADDAQLKLRFEREAKTISQLNHPNICTLYDVGDGYLVMELLDGESLADRLAKGPLPIGEVLKVGIQVAEALGRAHREGVIHRDLKPGNVMLTKSGAKLLDFGLARVAGVPRGTAVPVTAATQLRPLTQEGTILGTLQYMAPEQLAGEEPDARTDIFALGAVLYEMATGRRAFEGKSRTSLIGAIVSGEPKPISHIQPVTPPAFEHVVNRCLAKEPEERWQSAIDVAEELRWISGTGSQAGVAQPVAHRRERRKRLAWLLNAALVVATAAITWGVVQLRREPPRVINASINAPEKAEFAFDVQSGPAVLSRDGKRIAFPAGGDAGRMLWVRQLDAATAQPLPGTEDSQYPFWSPDGRYLGFFAGGKLKKINVNGGPAESLCDVVGSLVRGASWSRDGVILFTPGIRDSLSRVPAVGGTPVAVTKLNPGEGEFSHRFPFFLPDGQHFLYAALNSSAIFSQTKIYVGSLDGKTRKYLLDASGGALYVPSGYILFVRDRTLLAQAFDVKRLQLSGEARPIAEKVQFFESSASAIFDASDDGTLAYQSSGGGQLSQMVWTDLSGKEIATIGEPALIDGPRLSHHGDRIIYAAMEPTLDAGDLWLLDVARGVPTRFTFDRARKGPAVWSPDDKQIAYTAGKSFTAILMKTSDGVSQPETVFDSPDSKMVTDWSPDGRYILYQVTNPTTRSSWDLWVLDLQTRKASPFLHMPYAEQHGAFSPDSKWIAYSSDETGLLQVYVQPFPPGTGKWQISSAGGSLPQWTADGRHLFFRSGVDGKVWIADIETQPAFRVSVPRLLTSLRVRLVFPAAHTWSVTPDGQRFLVNKPLHEDASAPITIVTNWAEQMNR